MSNRWTRGGPGHDYHDNNRGGNNRDRSHEKRNDRKKDYRNSDGSGGSNRHYKGGKYDRHSRNNEHYGQSSKWVSAASGDRPRYDDNPRYMLDNRRSGSNESNKQMNDW